MAKYKLISDPNDSQQKSKYKLISDGGEKSFNPSKPHTQDAVVGHLRTRKDIDEAVALSGGDLDYSLAVTHGIEPKMAQKIKTISKENSLPMNYVIENYAETQNDDKARRIKNKLLERREDGELVNPITARLFSDPDYAAVLKNDVERLPKIEQIVNDANRGFVGKARDAMTAGAISTASGFAKLPGAFLDTAIGNVPGMDDKTRLLVSKLINDSEVGKVLDDYADEIRPETDSIIDQLAEGEIAGAAYDAFLKGTESIPTLMAMLAAGPAVGLTGLAATTYGETYDRAIKLNKSPNMAAVNATISSAGETLPELVTFGLYNTVMKPVAKELVTKIGKSATSRIIVAFTAAMFGDLFSLIALS